MEFNWLDRQIELGAICRSTVGQRIDSWTLFFFLFEILFSYSPSRDVCYIYISTCATSKAQSTRWSWRRRKCHGSDWPNNKITKPKKIKNGKRTGGLQCAVAHTGQLFFFLFCCGYFELNSLGSPISSFETVEKRIEIVVAFLVARWHFEMWIVHDPFESCLQGLNMRNNEWIPFVVVFVVNLEL